MPNKAELPVHLARVDAKAEQARRDVEAARQQLAQAERLTAFWDDLAEHLRGKHPASVLLVLKKEEGHVRALSHVGDPMVATLDEIRAGAEARAQEAMATFGRDFPDAVRQVGLQIDSTSRHPRYTFKQGFVRVEVDERDLTAKVSSRDGVDIVIGMDVGPLVETLQHETVRIFDRKLDADTFVRRLYTAYSATLRAEGRPENEEVPLRRVMHRMAKNLNHFAGDEFNVDMAELVKSGNSTVDGLRMHLNHTRNTRLGVLLYGLESGGYVGFISFKKEG